MISEEYRKLNEQLHADRADYGAGGHKWAPTVIDLARELAVTSILDYGCGKRTLEEALKFSIRNYDPAIPGLDAPPEPADLVVCTDVLEHIEPEHLEAVLGDIRRCTLKAALLVVATRPAKKTLADGRNAHLIQRPIEEWLADLGLLRLWTPMQLVNFGGEFLYIGRPK